MSKIEELLDSIEERYEFNQHDTKRVMIEYAEWYLEQFKQQVQYHFEGDDNGVSIIHESNFNRISNPEHE